MRKLFILGMLTLCPLSVGLAQTKPPKVVVKKFPLPLPKSYKLPANIQEIVLYCYKNAESVVDFRERYGLVYDDKSDLKSMLMRPLTQELHTLTPRALDGGAGEAQYALTLDMLKQLQAWQ